MISLRRKWTRSVIGVAGGGRAFVVGGDAERFVITAGHCLPRFPPSHSFSRVDERTYAELLCPLGSKQAPVWAECCFVDPICDLAVLRSPDSHELPNQADAYDALVEAAVPLPVGDLPLIRSPITLPPLPMPLRETITTRTILGPPGVECKAWLLSLDGRWFPCDVTAGNRSLSIVTAADKIAGGMSGSPIVSDDGKAIGVLVSTPGSPQPFLWRNLPRWLLDEIDGAPPPADA